MFKDKIDIFPNLSVKNKFKNFRKNGVSMKVQTISLFCTGWLWAHVSVGGEGYNGKTTRKNSSRQSVSSESQVFWEPLKE